MKHYWIVTVVFLFFLSKNLFAGPVIEFEEMDYDFGLIKEENGPVEYSFVFENKGDSPLIIESVQASCGCTTPGWTKDPVMPDGKGYVKALYNPTNRPGIFHKTLTVRTNATPGVSVLHIKGSVKPKPRTPAEEYPTKLGGIRIKYSALHVGKITTKGSITKMFDVYNDSDKSIAFLQQEIDAPEYISFSFAPEVLKPQETGKIIVSYDPLKKDDLGFVSDYITLKTNEEQDAVKKLRVVAMIEEYFPPMTPEELAQAPRISFEESVHDFGTINKGEVVTTELSFTNLGEKDLVIRKTKANCGCTVSEPSNSVIKSGEQANLSVTFNSAGRQGNQQKSVTIFSNDPREPMKLITIKARVN